LGDHPAHRRADDVGSLDTEVVEHGDGVAGHVGQQVRRTCAETTRQCAQHSPDVGSYVIELGGKTHVAVVVANDEVTQVGDSLAELGSIADALRTKTVHEQHRRVSGAAKCFIEKIDVTVVRERHLASFVLTTP
jgi:hypothetical protein